MSIDTLGGLMFGEIEGTELGLIVEGIEILILCIVMNQMGQTLLLVMCVGTVISIGALIDRVRVMETEVLLIFLVVVVFLH